VRFSSTFYRGAALCSVASAITTLALIFLPRFYQPVIGFDARMALIEHPAYVLRSWIHLIHPFLVMTTALAVAVRCRTRAAGAASLGLLGFVVWGATEAAQQALTIVALDATWRAAWPTADAATRQSIRDHVAVYDAIWNSLYLLLLLGFLAGNVFMAIAVRSAERLARWVSTAYWAAAGLTLLILVPEVGGPALPGGVTAWLYPLIQPAGRALTGVWLWREARHATRADP
jgi:hypothetical protein